MQISRLGRRCLRDRDGVAPWGRAATCPGSPEATALLGPCLQPAEPRGPTGPG